MGMRGHQAGGSGEESTRRFWRKTGGQTSSGAAGGRGPRAWDEGEVLAKLMWWAFCYNWGFPGNAQWAREAQVTDCSVDQDNPCHCKL